MIASRIREVRKALGTKMSQEEFGATLGVSRSVIANIEYDKVAPTDLFLKMLCKTYNVNMDWLMTGEGEMFVSLSRAEQIAAFAGSVLASDENDFRFRFIDAITQLSPQGWAGLEELVNNINGEKKSPDD